MIRKTDLRKKAGKFFAVMASAAMVGYINTNEL